MPSKDQNEQDKMQPLEIEFDKEVLLRKETSSKRKSDQDTPSQEKPQKVTVDDIVRAIPFGKFQILMIIIFHLIYSSSSIVVYNYAFFELYPQYLCKENNEWSHCSREEMCRQ